VGELSRDDSELGQAGDWRSRSGFIGQKYIGPREAETQCALPGDILHAEEEIPGVERA